MPQRKTDPVTVTLRPGQVRMLKILLFNHYSINMPKSALKNINDLYNQISPNNPFETE